MMESPCSTCVCRVKYKVILYKTALLQSYGLLMSFNACRMAKPHLTRETTVLAPTVHTCHGLQLQVPCWCLLGSLSVIPLNYIHAASVPSLSWASHT